MNKDELQNIISGKGKVKYGAIIQAAASYFKGSEDSSTVAQDYKQFKKQETKILEKFITENDLWI